jgi:hypothetical protein
MYSLDMLRMWMDQQIAKKAQERDRKRICLRVEISTDPKRDHKTTHGDVRLRRIRDMLNGFGLTRSVDQKVFHTHFINACLPVIFGSDYQENHVRIMQENNITDIHSECLVMTPRRFGKTTSVAMYVCALLLCVPGIVIAIFSTGKRASTSLTDLVRSFLTFIPGATERIVTMNQERLFIAATALPSGNGPHSQMAKEMSVDPTTSKLYSFPGESKGKISMHIYLFCRFFVLSFF